MKFKEIVHFIPLYGGCAPLSGKAENEAFLVLKKMNKEEYSISDLFLALFVAAEKFNEQLDTQTFRQTIPSSDLKIFFKKIYGLG